MGENEDSVYHRRISKFFDRIERSLNSNREWIESLSQDPNLDKYMTPIFIYDENSRDNNVLSSKRQINWDLLEAEIRAGLKLEEDQILPKHIREDIEFERNRQYDEEERWRVNETKKLLANLGNKVEGLPKFEGKWRKEPYPIRQYEVLTKYVVTSSIAVEEGKRLEGQLNTPLNGFLGQAYSYNDNALTEEWMSSFTMKEVKKTPSEYEIIRTQIDIIVETLLNRVHDRVCTDKGYLDKPLPRLGKEVIEKPVWGIDYATRRLIECVIENRLRFLSDPLQIKNFIEKKLLPAINAQPPMEAHDMRNALNHIMDSNQSSERDLKYAETLLLGMACHDSSYFRIHPKGTGVICNIPEGIPPHTVITEYLGELYPPYRWCEKFDVIELAQKSFGLKPTLPDFYNILLERPRTDPNGYALLYVDASQKANLGSSCSHSCDPNCTSAVVARNGKLTIVLSTNREVMYGEELCMDYCSITSSEHEAQQAICLCGMVNCRGSFLRLSTQDSLQQIFNSKCGPTLVFSSLLRSCAKTFSTNDQKELLKHGLLTAALGETPPYWLKKFIAEILRFVEFERKALPCALLRKDMDGALGYTFVGADCEARSVMEQRIQSLVCCSSLIGRVLDGFPSSENVEPPLVLIPVREAIESIWTLMSEIPSLLEIHLNKVSKSNGKNDDEEGDKGIRELTSPIKDKTRDMKIASGEEGVSSVPLSPWKMKWNEASPSRMTTRRQSPSPAIPSRSYRKSLQDCHPDVRDCILAIEAELSRLPKDFKDMKLAILRMREALMNVKHMSEKTARITLLCDVLVLWAHTTNFVSVQKFSEVISEPIAILARDLGATIYRSQLSGVKDSSDIDQHLNLEMKDPMLASKTARKPNARGRKSGKQKTHELNGIEPSELVDPDDKGDDLKGEEIPIESGLQPMEMDSGECSKQSPLSICEIETLDSGPIPSSPGKSCANHVDETAVSAPNGVTDKEGPKEIEIESDQDTKEKELKRVQEVAGNLYADEVLSPNEVVYSGSRVYDPFFIYSQAMGWVHAGTDHKITIPNLFGCVQLPRPSQCFGESIITYGEKEREELINILSHDVNQIWPWPDSLRNCFTDVKHDELNIVGSPMLDVSLGSPSTMKKVLNELSKGSSLTNRKGSLTDDQYDEKLPPEAPCHWVACDKCQKWRRVRWDIDEDSLPENWECSMNYWSPENASCDAPSDDFDPDTEGAVMANGIDGNASLDQYQIGSYYDVYCIKNHIFYEAKIVKIKPPAKENELGKLLFHFKGWNSRSDEWIEAGSARIQPHHTTTIRDTRLAGPASKYLQEKFQGFGKLKNKPNSKKNSLPEFPIEDHIDDEEEVVLKSESKRQNNKKSSSKNKNDIIDGAIKGGSQKPAHPVKKNKQDKSSSSFRYIQDRVIANLGPVTIPGQRDDDESVENNSNKRRRKSNSLFVEDFVS